MKNINFSATALFEPWDHSNKQVTKHDHELEMIRQLINAGYKGPWGILGHIKTEDVQKVLNRNIDGLTFINSELNKEIE